MSPEQIPHSEDILVVDDTPANLRLLAQMLTGQGYKVRAVTSGARAIESARTTPPSLILLDIRMPEQNGYEVCEQLKADELTRDIPIIFISALDDIQDKVRAFKMGGVDYVTKPFQIEEVLARTETHLALRRLQKQLQEANKRFKRELTLAGKIQASFLPHFLPDLPGWQFSAKLAPAREMSGDFFDIIPLPDGQLGILVADVVDKGAGAALVMALSLSLIRTYLAEYPRQPALVFNAVNHRILIDTEADQYVTVFLGVLNPEDGSFIYANAGQSPPLLLAAHQDGEIKRLARTGLPLGIFEDQTWEQKAIQIDRGDVMVLYTDGVTEAQNPLGTEFGEQRLIKSIKVDLSRPVQEIQEQLLSDIYQFAGMEHLDDDIALVILTRLAAA